MRIAIATGVWYRPHETQIAFHAANLMDGDTVILARARGDAPPDDRPALIWGPSDWSPGPLPAAAGFLRALAAYPRTRSLRVPQGARRARMIDFLHETGVRAVLAEFGTEAVRVAPVAQAAGLPCFAYFRGADASSQLRTRARVEAYRLLMPRLAGVFSVSRFLLDRLAARGIRHPNAHVVPSGVDTDRFRPAEKRPASFLAVGRFIEKKRPDITIRAFAEAARDRPEARLEMIGDGPLLHEAERLVADLGLTGRVILAGRRPHDEVRERLAATAVFLQHSVTGADGDTEGLPTSIQEAMAAGMATVSTRHAGIPEAVTEGETGLLVDEHDEAGFARAIGDCLADPARVAAMGAQAREVAVARFDNRRLKTRVEAEIRRAVEGG